MKIQFKQLVVGALAWVSLLAHAQTLTLGVVPQQSATVLAANWTPILQYLKDKTGVELRFATAADIPTFEQRVLDGDYDIAYMNPYHFTFFNEHRGFRAMVRRGDASIQGIIVVRKDSGIENLEQLNGKRLAFPSPAAFAASVIPRAEIASKGIKIEPVYVSSHDSVYLNVAKGFFPAGGGIARTFNATSEQARDELKVLWKTQPYTPHAVAAHPRVDTATRETLTQAFVEMSNTEEGQVLLDNLKIKRWQASNDSDWDDVRSLGITLLDPLVK